MRVYLDNTVFIYLNARFKKDSDDNNIFCIYIKLKVNIKKLYIIIIYYMANFTFVCYMYHVVIYYIHILSCFWLI